MKRRTVPGRLAVTLAAALVSAASAEPVGGYHVEYSGYSHGFLVLKLTGALSLTANEYDIQVAFQTAGVAGLVTHADSDSHAKGRFAGGQAQPSLFEASGHMRGTARVTRIVYAEGDPVVQALTPPVEQERSPVPAAQTRHTIDTLSAAALLIHQVGGAAQCDGSVSTYDGRRLATQDAHTAGQEMLAHSGRSIFAGQALRCEVTGHQLAGFIRGESQADLKRPRHGTVWLANMLQGGPPVPVRVSFDHRLLGQVTLYLTALTPSG